MHLQSAKLRKRLFLLTELVLVGCVRSGTKHVQSYIAWMGLPRYDAGETPRSFIQRIGYNLNSKLFNKGVKRAIIIYCGIFSRTNDARMSIGRVLNGLFSRINSALHVPLCM